MWKEIERKLASLPNSPGVYLFKGFKGEVLYVGKATSLRSRVRSYFQAGTSDTRFFISRLSDELADIETVVVGSEKEAALLENTLIKQHRPLYNVRLRDDKEYLSLRLSTKARWPRIEVVRKPKADGSLYFGPYHSAGSARAILRLANRHFQLRTCTDSELNSRTRPCLQFQIKRCLAPCVMAVDRARYDEQVADVAMFLDGRHDELVHLIEGRMKEASAKMAYERAAEQRDQLRAIDYLRQKNRVAVVLANDQDVVGLYRQVDQAEVAVLQIRAGKLTDVRTFALKDVNAPDDEIVANFVAEYYGPGSFVPPEVLLPLEVEAMDGLAELLSTLRDRSVKVLAPKRGARADLVQMARENASHAYFEKSRARDDMDARLLAVQTKLRLPRLPRRIECVDISHTGGSETVSCVVALENGAPDRRRYRSFHVKRVSGGDDYNAMYEVLSRRFRRGKAGEAGWELPDLLVVDGGRGQLHVALRALSDHGIADVPVAALAKEKANVMGDKLVDRIYLPGQKNPIELRESHRALSMLAVARDEAHRASNALRLKLSKKNRIHSRLDDVPGIGKMTRERLLKHFGSVRSIEEADEASLRSAGATVAQAQAIIRFMRGPTGPDDLSIARKSALKDIVEIEGEEATLAGAEDAAIENAFDDN